MSFQRLAPILAFVAVSTPAAAKEWFVAPGGSGNGDAASPFGSVQKGIDAAQPGDIVSVKAGTYAESLKSVRAGAAATPITVRAEPAGSAVLVESAARLLTVAHAFFVVEGLVFDGKYVNDDLIRVESAATGLVLRSIEVRRATKDCIDMGGPKDVLIEKSKIHHCLNAAGGQTDAHGVVGGPVKNLVIRDTEIHTFSGDAIQFDPGRQLPGWSDIRVEGCKLWTGPLAAAENGFAAGTVTGENAIDTKTNAGALRAKLTVIDTMAWGFQKGLITNMAAFNLKENIDAVLDRVTVYDSEIAFRTRGPGSNGGAWVRIQNAVVHDVAKAVRYEDDIEKLSVLNSTFGLGVAAPFQQASSAATKADVRNLLVLGSALPKEAAATSNLFTAEAAFVAAASDDYHLAAGATAIDKGEALSEVPTDRDGTARPQGAGYDVGAYEQCSGAACGSAGGSGGSGAGGSAAGGGSGGAAGAGGASAGGTSAAGAGGANVGGSAGTGSGASDSGDDGGCGCRTPRRSGGAGLAWALGALVSVARFRRRR